MMAAAAAWDGVAAELDSSATGYWAVITELASSPWLGPASRSMVAAATPYIAWLSSAATLAEEAGNRARAAAAAYESAVAMMVPPPVIAANRMLLMTLVATNFFGQNSAAIAATAAEYAEMWAQDAAAMYAYAGSSAAASELTPFTEPARTTDPAGLAGLGRALLGQVAGTTAGTATRDLVTASAIPQLLQNLSSSASSAGLNPNDWWIVQTLGSISVSQRQAVFRTFPGLAYFAQGIATYSGQIGQQLTFGPGGSTAGARGAWYPTPEFAGLGLRGVAGGPVSAISANLASAGKVGGLSVPTSWASTGTIGESIPQAMDVDYLTDPHAGASGLLRGIPVGGGGRRAAGGFPPREYGFKRGVLVRSPSAG